MSIAFMRIFDVNVIQRIWDFGPSDDITIRVLHRNHAMQLEEGEYIFTVPIGATLERNEAESIRCKVQRNWMARC